MREVELVCHKGGRFITGKEQRKNILKEGDRKGDLDVGNERCRNFDQMLQPENNKDEGRHEQQGKKQV